ncbi:hypothetical protein [Orrella sp. 11846]|uniref:hypothetical protein n=1 Tax=Orrella sp. 11846 TaxID=3409913 RepID=UPI003B599756
MTEDQAQIIKDGAISMFALMEVAQTLIQDFGVGDDHEIRIHTKEGKVTAYPIGVLLNRAAESFEGMFYLDKSLEKQNDV